MCKKKPKKYTTAAIKIFGPGFCSNRSRSCRGRNMRSFSKNRQVRMAVFALACVIAIALLISGCAHQPKPLAYEPPGFWSGLLHGFLILFSFIGSLFTDVRIYAFPNSGGWYDFGYLIGASMFLGGGGASANS